MRRSSRIEGRVLDEEERGVVAARVFLRPGARSVLTGSDGTFAFDRLKHQHYRISAESEDQYSVPLAVTLNEPRRDVVLRMCRGVRFVVHVTAGGAPLANAAVVLNNEAVAISADDGIAVVRGMPPGHHEGWIHARGWEQHRLILSLDRDPGGILERFVTLRRGVRIDGVVLGFGSRPMSGATIMFWNLKDGRLAYEARVREGGAWYIDAHDGTYVAVVSSQCGDRLTEFPVECDGITSTHHVVRVGPKTLGEAIVSLSRVRKRFATRSHRSRLAGLVVDVNERPISGVQVRVCANSTRSGTRWTSTVTDALGRFEVGGIDNEDYAVTTAGAAKRVCAGDAFVKLVVNNRGSVTGRLLLDGRPVQYFGVVATPEQASPVDTSLEGIRSVTGRFTLSNLAAGIWRFGLLGPSTTLKILSGVRVDETPVDLGDILMERGQRVEGHVYDSNGHIVAGARVIVGYGTFQENVSRLRQWFAGRYETITDAGGAFIFEGIHAQRDYELSPHIRATHIDGRESLVRELPQGEVTTDLTLLDCGQIEGVVRGFRGGTASALATRRDEPALARTSNVDTHGHFSFPSLPIGTYCVSLDLPKGENVSSAMVTVIEKRTASVELTMVSANVQLRVKATGVASAKLLVLEPLYGQPGDSQTVGGERSAVRPVSCTQVNSDVVVYSFMHLTPGSYRISLDGVEWIPVLVKPSPQEQMVEISAHGAA